MLGISILQDSFADPKFDKEAFSNAKQSSNEDEVFIWKNNQSNEDGLIITEKEPMEIQKFPAISVSLSGGEGKNLSLGQFLRNIAKNGRKIGEVIGGGGEFDLVYKCCTESTAHRKRLADRVMANLLINRETFFNRGACVQHQVRRSQDNETPYFVGDKRMYFVDITAHYYGEWEFEIIPNNLQRLAGFNQIMSLSYKTAGSSLNLLWNVLQKP